MFRLRPQNTLKCGKFNGNKTIDEFLCYHRNMDKTELIGSVIVGIILITLFIKIEIFITKKVIKAVLAPTKKMEDEGYEFIGGTWVDPHKFNPSYKSPKELREEKEKEKTKTP